MGVEVQQILFLIDKDHSFTMRTTVSSYDVSSSIIKRTGITQKIELFCQALHIS